MCCNDRGARHTNCDTRSNTKKGTRWYAQWKPYLRQYIDMTADELSSWEIWDHHLITVGEYMISIGTMPSSRAGWINWNPFSPARRIPPKSPIRRKHSGSQNTYDTPNCIRTLVHPVVQHVKALKWSQKTYTVCRCRKLRHYQLICYNHKQTRQLLVNHFFNLFQ